MLVNRRPMSNGAARYVGLRNAAAMLTFLAAVNLLLAVKIGAITAGLLGTAVLLAAAAGSYVVAERRHRAAFLDDRRDATVDMVVEPPLAEGCASAAEAVEQMRFHRRPGARGRIVVDAPDHDSGEAGPRDRRHLALVTDHPSGKRTDPRVYSPAEMRSLRRRCARGERRMRRNNDLFRRDRIELVGVGLGVAGFVAGVILLVGGH